MSTSIGIAKVYASGIQPRGEETGLRLSRTSAELMGREVSSNATCGTIERLCSLLASCNPFTCSGNEEEVCDHVDAEDRVAHVSIGKPSTKVTDSPDAIEGEVIGERNLVVRQDLSNEDAVAAISANGQGPLEVQDIENMDVTDAGHLMALDSEMASIAEVPKTRADVKVLYIEDTSNLQRTFQAYLSNRGFSLDRKVRHKQSHTERGHKENGNVTIIGNGDYAKEMLSDPGFRNRFHVILFDYELLDSSVSGPEIFDSLRQQTEEGSYRPLCLSYSTCKDSVSKAHAMGMDGGIIKADGNQPDLANHMDDLLRMRYFGSYEVHSL